MFKKRDWQIIDVEHTRNSEIELRKTTRILWSDLNDSYPRKVKTTEILGHWDYDVVLAAYGQEL